MGASRASFLYTRETFLFQYSFSFGLLHISFDCFYYIFELKNSCVNVEDGCYDTDWDSNLDLLDLM